MKQRLLILSLVVMLLGVGIDGWGQITVTFNFSTGGAVTDLNQARPGIDLDGNIGLGSFKNGGTVNFKNRRSNTANL